ncbi:hypothetical protein HDV05_002320, partial [Chytridiales sp. JEL 0842]
MIVWTVDTNILLRPLNSPIGSTSYASNKVHQTQAEDMVNVIAILASIPLLLAVHRLITHRTKKDEPNIPTLDLWSTLLPTLLTSPSTFSYIRLLRIQLLTNPLFQNATLVRASLYPFFSIYILNTSDGIKLFHSHKKLDIAEGYNELIGRYRGEEMNYSARVYSPIKALQSVLKAEKME